MDIIQEIITENTEGKKLSDQKITDLLAQKGIKIARRTVAKYRQNLNIDSSYMRTS
jgi:RNA polymerase sigma-54 factor